MNDWMRVRQLYVDADAALDAAMAGLGTSEFPLLLATYRRAMERAYRARVNLRNDQRLTREPTDEDSRKDLRAPSF